MEKFSTKCVILAAAVLFTLSQVSASPITIAELESDSYTDTVESIVQELLSYDATAENLFEENDLLLSYADEEDNVFLESEDEIAYYSDDIEEGFMEQDSIAETIMLENYMLGETTITYEVTDTIISELDSENLLALAQDIPISFTADFEE